MPESSKFTVEQEIFKKNREKWLTEGRVGQYVVIKNSEISGFYKSSSDAFNLGVEKYGINSFFMSSILPEDATNISFFGLAV